MIGTGGGLSSSFAEDTFGIDEIYTHWHEDLLVTNIDLPKDAYVRCSAHFGGYDSLRVARNVRNSDFFRPSPFHEPLLWLEPAISRQSRIRKATPALYFIMSLREKICITWVGVTGR